MKRIDIKMDDGSRFNFTDCEYNYNESFYYIIIKDEKNEIKQTERFPIRHIFHIVEEH